MLSVDFLYLFEMETFFPIFKNEKITVIFFRITVSVSGHEMMREGIVIILIKKVENYFLFKKRSSYHVSKRFKVYSKTLILIRLLNFLEPESKDFNFVANSVFIK